MEHHLVTEKLLLASSQQQVSQAIPNPGLANAIWINAWIESGGTFTTGDLSIDVCPYREGDRLLAVVVIDRSLLIGSADPDPDYRLIVGLLPSSLEGAVRDLVRGGRVVTRLHSYPQGDEVRYLLLHRAQSRGEAVRTIVAAERETFVRRCAQERTAGFELVGLAVRMIEMRVQFGPVRGASESEVYDAVLLQTTRRRA